MNILFVCKYNRFRSRVAEAYFKKINKKVKVKSAGIIKGSPLNANEVGGAKSEGLNISGKPQGISTKLLQWQDVIVIVADDVPSILFKINRKYGKKLFVLKIKDIRDDNKKGIVILVKEMKRKLDRLNKKIRRLK